MYLERTIVAPVTFSCIVGQRVLFLKPSCFKWGVGKAIKVVFSPPVWSASGSLVGVDCLSVYQERTVASPVARPCNMGNLMLFLSPSCSQWVFGKAMKVVPRMHYPLSSLISNSATGAVTTAAHGSAARTHPARRICSVILLRGTRTALSP